jgi:hypothetical protein
MSKAARAKKGRTLAVVDIGEDTDQEVEKEEDAARGIPLFEGLADEVKIEVYRMEPIEEGTIGTLAPDADEATIARRWGGGVYRVTAKGTDGKFGRKQRTVTIGGDPRFESKDANRKYRIKIGELPDENKTAAPVAPGFDVSGLLSIVQASHQNAMAFMQAQLAAQAQQAQAQQLAQQQANQAQQVAAAKMADEGRQRDREFFTTMLALQKADQKATDPLAMIPVMVKFLELGKDMAGGGGEADPVAAFIANLPQIIPQAQALLESGKVATAARAAVPPQPEASGLRVTLTGGTAEQLQKTIEALQGKGYDPEKSLVMALAQLEKIPNAPTKPDAPAPPAAAGPAAKETTTPARATRRK